MALDLTDLPDPGSRQRGKDMRDALLVLAYNLYIVGSKQLMVGKEGTGYGILNCHKATERGVPGNLADEFVESLAFDRLYVTTIIFAGSCIMEASGHTLYGDPS